MSFAVHPEQQDFRNKFAKGNAGIFSRCVNLSIDLRDEARGERFAICCRRHGNREGPVFLSLSIRRKRTRPSSWRRRGDVSPICHIREGSPALRLLVSSWPSPNTSGGNTPRLRLGARLGASEFCHRNNFL